MNRPPGVPDDDVRENDIAIVGMSGRFPGARDVEELWANLCGGVESIAFFTDDELRAAGIEESRLRDPAYVKAAGLLAEIDCFDHELFGVTPREAELMDPQHRLFLECAWAALEHAGYDPGRYDGAIGLFAGSGMSRYLYRYQDEWPAMGLQVVILNDKDYLSTRVSYKLNLRGPSVAVQTACSTSLVAVHLACQSLLSGECDMALAGGVSIKLLERSGYRYLEGGIMSPDGHCRAFDARAQGTVNGDGLGLVLLKPLASALADGDTVYAVIKGSAINNDGTLKAGYTAPSAEGQARAISEAQAVAGVAPETISYIEAHGTGTPLGDPIEISALASVFAGCPAGSCAIGSLKTNVGHLDPAAGIAGLIKTVLALHHGQLPPSLHFEHANPALSLESTPFYVNARLAAWDAPRPRRAGVSSFGIGGTNAHVVLEEAGDYATSGDAVGHIVGEAVGERETIAPRPQLLILSARTELALEEMTARLAAHLRAHPEIALADAAYTLQVGRRPLDHRRSLVATTAAEAAEILEARGETRLRSSRQALSERPVVFMFPGQGAQHAAMARELYEHQLSFRADIDACAAILARGTGDDLRAVLFVAPTDGPAGALTLDDTHWTQPALFAIEYALARVWMRWGIEPVALIGHSLGEIVCACLAGTFSLEAALTLVAARGRLMQASAPGAMASVHLAEADLQPLLDDGIVVAAVNGPSLCTVAGPPEQVAAWLDRCAALGIKTRALASTRAFHSASMDPILEPFARCVAAAAPRAPRRPFVSNLTGTWITAAEATDPAYWCRHLREAVRFGDGLEALHAHPDWILLEVGPSQTLSTLARMHPGRPLDQIVLSSLPSPKRTSSDEHWLLDTLGQLWIAGVAVRWDAEQDDAGQDDADGEHGFAGASRRRVALPTYPFARTRHWIERPLPVANGLLAAVRHVTEGPPPPTQSRPTPAPLTRAAVRSEVTVMLESTHAPLPVDRRETLASALRDVLQGAMGLRAAAIDPRATLLELGADSLLLLNISQVIAQRFGVRVPFRVLLEEMSTIEALAAHLDREMPPDPVAAPTPEPARRSALAFTDASASQPVSEQARGTSSRADATIDAAMAASVSELAADDTDLGVIERLMTRQLAVMSEQMALLQGRRARATSRTSDATSSFNSGARADNSSTSASRAGAAASATPAAPAAPAAPTASEAFVAYRPIDTSQTHGLGARQRQHLDALSARYTRRTPGSKRLAGANRGVLADSSGTTGFRVASKEMCYPIAVQRAAGAHVWDVDDNRYVDIGMGFGTLMFGHSPAFVLDAVRAQMDRGLQLGLQSPLSGEVARRLCAMTGLERAAFCNSGTEAVMIALRLARTATGRTPIALFTGSYHGTFDGVLVRRGQGAADDWRALPMAPGVPAHMVDQVTVLPYASGEALELLRRDAARFAAILVEPVQSRRPELPVAFLQELRALTAAAGTALIFDEVITGFRLDPGGAQALCGVRADLATYGKVLGAGMPVGAVAGTTRFMNAIDGGAWEYGDDSFPRADTTYVAGTFFKHPLVMAAACAVLRHLQEQGPALQQAVGARAARLVAEVNALSEARGCPIRAVHIGSMFRFTGPRERSVMDLFFYHLLEKGIFVTETRNCFLSTEHTDADVDAVIAAVRDTLRELDEAGYFETAASAASPAPPRAVDDEPRERTVEVTEGQRGLWVFAQLSDEHARVYNQPVFLRLFGAVDVAAVRRAVQHLVDRHDALRSRFSADGRHQRIAAQLTLDVPLIDLHAGDPATREAILQEWLRDEANHLFDLGVGPLVRIRLARLADTDHVLAMTAHHSVIDGWSIDVLLRELGAAYAAETRQQPYQPPAIPQFTDYVRWQASTEGAAAAEAFWLAQFADAVPVLDLPADHPRPPVLTHAGAVRHVMLDASLIAQLKAESTRAGCTLFMTLLASWQLLVHFLSGQDDVVVGTPAAGQSAMGSRDLVGFCVNMLPLRSRVSSDTTWQAHLLATRAALLDAMGHAQYPVSRLTRKLGLVRDPSRAPLIAAVFNMDQPLPPLDTWGMKTRLLASPIVHAHFDLHWNVMEQAGAAGVLCTYNQDLFDASTIDRWMAHYTQLLRAALQDPAATVSRLRTDIGAIVVDERRLTPLVR